MKKPNKKKKQIYIVAEVFETLGGSFDLHDPSFASHSNEEDARKEMTAEAKENPGSIVAVFKMIAYATTSNPKLTTTEVN